MGTSGGQALTVTNENCAIANLCGATAIDLMKHIIFHHWDLKCVSIDLFPSYK